MGNGILTYLLKRETARWIGLGLMILFFGTGFFFMFKAFGKDADPVLQIYYLFCGLGCGIAATCFFIKISLAEGSHFVANTFLSPKSYLKDAAVLLTPIQGKIAAGKYKEAEEDLLPLHEKHPGDPEIALVLMELYSDHCRDHYSAARTAETYFIHSPQRTNELHIRILMEYADLLMKSGNIQELLKLYKNQLQSGRLTPSEIKAVTLRLNNVQRKGNS